MTVTFITPGGLDKELLARVAAGPLKLAVAAAARTGDCRRQPVGPDGP